MVLVAYAMLTAPRAPAPAPGLGLVQPAGDALAYRYADGEALGSASAPVTLDVYSDYQCPACGNFAKQGLPGLVTELVATGRLRIVDHPVDILSATNERESTTAAVAASCAADQGTYWQYHDYLFWNQRGENQGAFSRDRLLAIADAVGLDRGSFEACLAEPGRAAAVQATTQNAGITSTPTFMLNGERVQGLQSWNDLVARAKALVPAGFSPVPPSPAPASGAATTTP